MTEGIDEANEPNRADSQSQAQSSSSLGIPTSPQNPPLGNAQAEDFRSNTNGAQSVRRELHWLEILNFCGQIILAIVAIVAAYIYGRQLGVMQGQLTQMQGASQQTNRLFSLYEQEVAELRKQGADTHTLAQTSRVALVQVQRAVMTTTTVDVSREAGQDGKVTNIVLFVRWKNVGATPTRNLTFRHNFLLSPQRLPNDFPFADIPDQPGTNSNTPSVAAPQGTVSAAPIKIPITEAQEIVDKKLVLTMWGHADYRDVLEGTPRHTSQYCFIVTGFYGNIYSTNHDEITSPATENCKTHNCQDDECKKK